MQLVEIVSGRDACWREFRSRVSVHYRNISESGVDAHKFVYGIGWVYIDLIVPPLGIKYGVKPGVLYGKVAHFAFRYGKVRSVDVQLQGRVVIYPLRP